MVDPDTERKLITRLFHFTNALGDVRLEKLASRAKNSLDFIEFDADEIDIELIRRNLEVNPNAVLTLYNYLHEKHII